MTTPDEATTGTGIYMRDEEAALTDIDPQLQLTPEELQLLLDTTAEDADFVSTMTRSHQDDSFGSSLLVSSPALTSSDSSDPLQAKRARRTEIERYSRRRRQSTLREMRDEVRQLEMEKAQLLAATPPQQMQPITGFHQEEEDEYSASSTGTMSHHHGGTAVSQSLLDKFIQLSMVTQRLEAEMDHLRKMLHARQLLAQSVQNLAANFLNDWDETTWHFMPDQPYDPLPREEHFRIMRETVETINAYDARCDCLSSGNAFLGWIDRRHVDTNGMFFSFSKKIPGKDPERVMLDSWEIFSEENKFKSLARANIPLRLRKLQVPNDDVFILHQHFKSPRSPMAVHCVFLMFRLRTENGFSIVMRSIPAPSIQESLQEGDIWADHFYWMHFKYLMDANTGERTGCVATLGGHINEPLRISIAEFLLGSFGAVVGWENACVAPIFLMPS